jgi:hypothetical protein
MSTDVNAWLAQKGIKPIAAVATPTVLPSAPIQSPVQRPALAAPQRHNRRADDALALALTMPIPSDTLLSIQPVVVSPVDATEHGSWAAISSPSMSVKAIAISLAEMGVVTSGVWLPTSSPYSPPTDLGTLIHWKGDVCPEPVSRLLAAGAPVISAPVVVAQQALFHLEWPWPARWLDVAVQMCTKNVDGEIDEVAAWLAGATDLNYIQKWSPLRDYTGIVLPRAPMVDAIRKAVAMTRLALGVASVCGTSLGSDREEAAWKADQMINARGIPIDRTLILGVQGLGQESHIIQKFSEVQLYACNDDRVRGAFRFVGQHTGRWTAQEPALHNLRKTLLETAEVQGLVETVRKGGIQWVQEFYDKLVETLRAKDSSFPGSVGELLGNLERPMFCAPPGMVFVVGDQKQAEPRGVFYFAGLQKVLATMDERDLYLDPALQKSLFGDAVPVDHSDAKRRRNVLKIVVIACGYGMGGDMLRKYALDGWGFDFEKSGIDPANAVDAYRRVFRKVKELWYSIGTYSRDAIKHETTIKTDVGTFEFSDGDLLFHLRSGRTIVYPKATVVDGDMGKVVEYWKGGPLRGNRDTAWGGTLFQHSVTGTLRDAHAGHLVELEAAGLNPVSHCHDEAVCLVPEGDGPAAVTAMAAIMSKSPAYLPGLPLKCKPYLTRRLGVEGLR